MYYIRGADDALYRRRDGLPHPTPPDEVLWPSGWARIPFTSRSGVDCAFDPALWTDVVVATEDEALELAASAGLPRFGW